MLITAAAMILGIVPMATGYSQNAPLGRAVIGGLLMATLFTLFFVPCVYAIVYTGVWLHNRRRSHDHDIHSITYHHFQPSLCVDSISAIG